MKRFLTILVVCGCLVGCDCDPFEKSSPYPPEVPPHHPDHDINKQPHEWKDEATTGKIKPEKSEDNATISEESRSDFGDG